MVKYLAQLGTIFLLPMKKIFIFIHEIDLYLHRQMVGQIDGWIYGQVGQMEGRMGR